MTTTSPVTSRTETGGSASPASSAALTRRAAARAVDMFTVLFVSLALVLLGLAPLMGALSDRLAPEPWGGAFAATALYTIVATVYEVVFTAVRGQTPGKDLFDLRVIDPETGEPPGWWSALVRALPVALLRLIPGLVPGTAAVGALALTAPWDDRRRGLHDIFAGTIVIDYDADAEEAAAGDAATADIDRDDLSRVYGPRSIWSLVTSRRPRGRGLAPSSRER